MQNEGAAATEKTCPDCGEAKPVSAFGVNRRRPDGLAHYCKACFARRNKDYYAKRRTAAGHKVRPRVKHPEGFKRCAQCDAVKPVSEFHRARGQSGGYSPYCKPCRSERTRVERFLRVYGLTPEAMEKLIADQGGRCAICRERPAEHVDHDHVTGSVRGVVCFRCNVGIGHFSDRIDVMRRAIDYLERTTWQRTQACPGVYRLTSPRLAAHRSASSSAMQRLISSRGAGSSPPE
jgi:hypothetical protein